MYYYIYIYLMFISIIELFLKIKLKILLKINIVLLIFFTGFRYYNGTDYETYLNFFIKIKKFKDCNYLEKGFVNVIVILKLIFENIKPEIFFIIFAFLGLCPLYLGIKNEKYPNYSLFIYYCIFLIDYNFNGVRQSIAMGWYVWSYSLYFSKKTLFQFVLAYYFHKSAAVIYAVSYFNKKKYKLNRRKIFGIYLMIMLFSSFCFELLKIIPKVNKYSIMYHQPLKSSSVLIRVILILIFYHYIKKEKIDSKLNSIFNIYICGFWIYGLFYPIGIFATRLNMFFRILEIVIIPKLFINIFKVRNKIIVFLIILVIISLGFFKNMTNPANIPYKIWLYRS